jgi:hypothetical protein
MAADHAAPVAFTLLDSPVGPLRLARDGDALSALHMEGQRHAPETGPTWARDDDAPVFRRAAEQLESAGKVGAGDKYPIDWVDTETFAQHHSMINSPPITGAVQPAGLSQAEPKTKPTVRR